MSGLKLELVADGLRFPEGPVILPDGSILLVEVARGTLSRVSPSGDVTVVADLGQGPNGTAIGPDGGVYVCNNGGRYHYIEREGLTLPSGRSPHHVRGSIQRVDLSTGEFVVLYDACDGAPLFAPNDLVFDHAGGFWFTDHGVEDEDGARWGALLYARPGGEEIHRAARLRAPNGVGLSPDGQVVYVADTYAGRLWAFDIVGPGQVARAASPIMPGRVIQTLPGFQLLDSLAVQANGDVCVGTIINGGITTFTPTGSTKHQALPDRLVTNLCFGGPDMRDVWITASSTGRLYKSRWPAPGLKLAFQV